MMVTMGCAVGLLLVSGAQGTDDAGSDAGLAPAESPLSLPVHVVTPEQHGARGDGHADDSKPIHAAVASCAGHSRCKVVLAKSYLSGPFTLNSSGISLEITGRLAALPRVAGCTSGKGCYPRSGAAQASWPAFINAYDLHDISVTGDGSIDFGGAPWWPCKKTGCWRPHLLNFTRVQSLAVRDIHLVDPANHFIRVTDCSGVRIERVTMTAPHTSPNTDGINFEGGEDQLLRNSTISNGDDCVSVIVSGPAAGSSGFSPCVAEPGLCRGGNVVVEDTICDGGHGASIGSIRHGIVTNVTFRRMTLKYGVSQTLDSGGGCRIKSYPNGTGSVSGVRYEDIDIQGVAYPLQILAEYCPKSQKPYPCPPGKTAVAVSNVSFARVRGFGKTSNVGDFDCGDVVPCSRIVLEDVLLMGPRGAAGKFACNHCGGSATNATPPACFG
jgi:polygalacturonase